MTDRRDFLKFAAGTALTSVLLTVGDPERVKIASALEVERFTKPFGDSGDLFWAVELRRPGREVPVLKLAGHPRSLVFWRAELGNEIILSSGRLRGFEIRCDVEEFRT